jgi:UDP-GlcNAc:undecaprenyl-phosphate/decaprenyl-phosphate GlcNAc-1-phosphate transferase
MQSEIKLLSFYRFLAFALVITLLIPVVHIFAEKNHFVYSAYLILLSFLASYVIMPFLVLLGNSTGLVDHPDEARKKHVTPTSLVGGLAIYCAFIVTLLLNFHFSEELKAIVIGSSVIFFLGIADDVWGLSASIRLIVQMAASLFVILSGVRMTFVPDSLGGVYCETILTMIWLIGITNAMNFIDGMDGIASGSAIIYSIFFSIIAFISNQTYLLFMTLTVAGSCLGFLPYNLRMNKPALVFLGDSGSTFLGFLLASFAILGDWGDSIIDVVIPILILSVLIFDMTLTTTFRIVTGEVKNFKQWIHYTGRDHLHHRLIDLGITKRQATWLFFGISITFGIEALAILFADVLVSVLILVHSIMTFFILGVLLVFQNRKNIPDKT